MTLVVYRAEPAAEHAEKLSLLTSSVLEPADGTGPERRAKIQHPIDP
jgi:hypothetical protein